MQPTQKSKVEILIVALASPVLVGVYQEKRLIEAIESCQKTSEALPYIFEDLLQRYSIESIYFARGPGSYMSIKLVYIFVKTIQIVSGIKLYGCEGFEFTGNQPIKAYGKHYFCKENDTIATKKFEQPPKSEFQLPKRLDQIRCSEETAPLYILPAVKV